MDLRSDQKDFPANIKINVRHVVSLFVNPKYMYNGAFTLSDTKTDTETNGVLTVHEDGTGTGTVTKWKV